MFFFRVLHRMNSCKWLYQFVYQGFTNIISILKLFLRIFRGSTHINWYIYIYIHGTIVNDFFRIWLGIPLKLLSRNLCVFFLLSFPFDFRYVFDHTKQTWPITTENIFFFFPLSANWFHTDPVPDVSKSNVCLFVIEFLVQMLDGSFEIAK